MAMYRDLDRMVQRVEGKRLDRRELVKRGAAIGLGSTALAGGLLTLGGPRGAEARRLGRMLQQDPSTGTKGGTLRIATISEPTTLDQHMNTTGITFELSMCVMETLFMYDSGYVPKPHLVETHTISEDGMTHTMVLRSGVPFHNGEILSAADAKASLERWGQISGVGKRLFEKIAGIEADGVTLTINLTQPYGTITVALSNNTQGCVIYPKSVIDANTLEPIPDEGIIGTGGYKFGERQTDAYFRVVRFEEYVGPETPTDGYSGKRYQYPDMIEYMPVPDEAARVAGLQAGDYDILMDASNDQYDVLNGVAGVVAEIRRPSEWDVYFLNWASPIMSNLAIRQAFQAAQDPLPQLLNGRGREEFLRLDPGLMMQETVWHTTAGQEHYNVNDVELAKAKLAEAGYDGTPIRWMCTQDYAYMYGVSVVAVQQLEAVGFKVDFQIIDWATVVERRAKQEEWDVFTTSHGFVPDPTQVSYVGQMNIYPGWWNDEGSLALAAELAAESDFDARYALWEQIQTNAYEQIPSIKVGDSSRCQFRSDKVQGMVEQIERGIPYWNIWLA